MQTHELLKLLLPSAHPVPSSEHLEQLARNFRGFQDWDSLVPFTEAQRIAPLFLHHAEAIHLDIPNAVYLRLQGLAFRHRLACQARQIALEEILTNAQACGIKVVLLKGAAAAWQVYPRPELRPMRDIDLLTLPQQAQKMQEILIELGFQPVDRSEHPLVSAKHLTGLAKTINGFSTAVEVHDRLFDPTWRVRSPRIEDWVEQAQLFKVGEQAAYTLSPAHMLWHTYQHMITEEVRLSSLADFVGIAEQYAGQINWESVRKEYPALINVLSVLNTLSPLNSELVQRAGICTGNPVEIEEDLTGWPRIPVKAVRELGFRRFLKATFAPSSWWLRLYFGLDPNKSIRPYQWLIYPLDIVRAGYAHIRLRFRPLR